MKAGIHGGQDAALGAEADIPALLVEVQVLCVEFLEEVRVTDVQLIGGDANDGACGGMSMARQTNIQDWQPVPYWSCSLEMCLEYWPFLMIS